MSLSRSAAFTLARMHRSHTATSTSPGMTFTGRYATGPQLPHSIQWSRPVVIRSNIATPLREPARGQLQVCVIALNLNLDADFPGGRLEDPGRRLRPRVPDDIRRRPFEMLGGVVVAGEGGVVRRRSPPARDRQRREPMPQVVEPPDEAAKPLHVLAFVHRPPCLCRPPPAASDTSPAPDAASAGARDDSSAHARVTAPVPGNRSTNLSPGTIPRQSNSQAQKATGLRPISSPHPRAGWARSQSRTPGGR